MGSEVQRPSVLSGCGPPVTVPESGSGGTDFGLLADALPHLVWICRPDGSLDYLNRRGLEYFGSASPALGAAGDVPWCPFPCGLSVHAEDEARAQSVCAQALRAGESLSLEARLRRCDGAYEWHLIRAQPVVDADGRVLKWIGTSTNVHEVKESNDRSAFLLSLSTELAPMGDPQELVCAAMIRLRERLGAALVTLVEVDEVLGEAVMVRNRDSDVSQIEVASLPLRPFQSLSVGAREGLIAVMRDVRNDGRDPFLHDRWFGLEGVGAVVSAPLLQGGSLVAVLSVVEARPRDWRESDIELVRRVADIVWPAFEKARADRSAEEALREMNRRKDEFLAMLSHELRNPLAPIRSAVQILRNHACGGSELEWARMVIERQTRHLVRLVDDLLDVSRMVRGQIVLQKHEIEVADVVRHGIETSRPLIRSRRHHLHVQLPATPLRLEGDLTRLAQVIANLLNNAAKYTEEGGDIWVEAALEESLVVVRVRDTGAGIASSLLPHVFDLFTQAERTLDRSQGGLGIGLTLVKLLVELHEGSVEVRSEGLGKGSEFIIRIPALKGLSTGPPSRAAADWEPASDQPERPVAGDVRAGGARAGDARAEESIRVLVVDDNVDAADSTAMLLSLDGFEAHSVHSAQAALEAVVSLKPDVVLLDIGLPEMDGYDVARRLRALPPGESPAIVALTGYGQPADRARAATAGFDEFLVKPVEPEVLNGLLRSLRGGSGQHVRPPA